MSMAELVVTAVMVQGRTKSEVARDFGIDQAVKAPRGPLRGTVTRDRATGR